VPFVRGAVVSAKLTEMQVAALLRVRYAGRYDELGRSRGTAEEYSQEQWAQGVQIDPLTYLDLRKRGMISGVPMRLTDAGRAALAEAQS
jgi:hypothetical protein